MIHKYYDKKSNLIKAGDKIRSDDGYLKKVYFFRFNPDKLAIMQLLNGRYTALGLEKIDLSKWEIVGYR